MTVKQQTLITTLEQVRIEGVIYSTRGFPGRPTQDCTAIARAFIGQDGLPPTDNTSIVGSTVDG